MVGPLALRRGNVRFHSWQAPSGRRWARSEHVPAPGPNPSVRDANERREQPPKVLPALVLADLPDQAGRPDQVASFWSK